MTTEAFAAQQLKEREEAAMPPFALPGPGARRCPHAGGRTGLLQAATAAAHAAELPGWRP